MVAACFWGRWFWRAWQVHELIEASYIKPVPVAYAPAYLQTLPIDRVVNALYQRPTRLLFWRYTFDESWFRRLSAVPEVRELFFEDTSFGDAGMQYLAPLRNLEGLHLDLCPKITDAALPQISRFEQLKTLSFNQTAVTDAGMRSLLPLRNLEALYLQGTTVGDAGLAYVAQLPNLRNVVVGRFDGPYSTITERGLDQLKTLPQLDTLSLMNVELTDATVASLRSMPKLKWLFLNLPRASPAELSRLRDLPVLYRLHLENAAVGDEIVDSLLAIPTLQDLALDGTRITDAGLARLASLRGLSHLSLARVPVSAQGLSAFNDHSQLSQLILNDTNMDDKAVDTLLSLPFLTLAHLAGTRITDSGIMRLASHPNLKSVNLSRTAITGDGVAGLLRNMTVISGLHFDETQLGDEDVDIFAKCKALQSSPGFLSLKKTRISQAGIARIREACRRLEIEWEAKR